MQTQRGHVESLHGALAAPTPRLPTDLSIPDKIQDSISQILGPGELHGRQSCIKLTSFECKEDRIPSTATSRAPAVHAKLDILGRHHDGRLLHEIHKKRLAQDRRLHALPMNYLLLLLVACAANTTHHVSEECAPNLWMVLQSQLPLTNLFAAMWQWMTLVYHR